MTVFNENNTAYKTGKYPLFLGQPLALYDSISKLHPILFDLYKAQKAQDWSEDEVDLAQSISDFKSCGKSTYDVMVQTLMWQWEADSVASQSIISMFAPFITNSELFAMMMKQSEIECVAEGTEVLTPKGWKPIENLQGDDLVAQYDKEGHLVTFVKPIALTKKIFKGNLISFKSPQGHFEQRVTPNHRMLALSRNGNFKDALAADMTYGWGWGAICSGMVRGKKKALLPIEQFLIASQADGSVSDRYDGSLVGTIPVLFGLSKERKIERLLSICKKANLAVRELTGSPPDGNTKAKRKFKVDLPVEFADYAKVFSWVNLSDVDESWCKDFLHEVSLWDGHITNKNISRLVSTNADVVDIVQGVASLCGMKTYRSSRKDSRNENFKDCHIVSWKPKLQVLGNSISKSDVFYDGNVYCVTVPSSYFLIRYNGAVSVTGNCLHALTYSDIIRQCLPDAKNIITQIMDNQEVLKRSTTILTYMRDLEIIGAKYRLDSTSVDEEEARRAILRALVALLGLEGIEFISSFACTFALAEQGIFIGVAQLVQKIMLDEILHTKMDFAVLNILLKDRTWKKTFNAIKGDLKNILDEVVENEKAWSDYIFSEGRSIIGLNPTLLQEWVYWNSAPIYEYLGIKYSFEKPKEDPLPFMGIWMNPSQQQNANQEQTNTDYKLNVTVSDDDGFEFDF